MADKMKLTSECTEGCVVNCEIDGFTYTIDYPNPQDPDHELQGTVPGGVLMAALAGCKTIVIRQFLAARKIDAPVNTEITMSSDTSTGKFVFDFDVNIKIGAELSEKDQDLIERFVSDKCAIEHAI